MLEGGDGTHRIAFIVAQEPDEEGLLAYRLVPHLEDGDDEAMLIGLEEEHADNGKTCGGYIAWAEPYGTYMPLTGHSLVSLSPLTISPSLSCQRCPSHGFIRDGRWHDA
jgi:hypothetical protein